MRAIAQRVQDNAMFYKDITQWLRNRTFVALFFGLLLFAEGISVFIMSLGDTFEDNAGQVVFYSLYFVLVVYAVVIAFMAHGLTAREFANKTFELYELSGMSLEKMISGKLISMLYQFLFGFFCIVPFMFFAYFLGGLDFFELFSGAIFTVLAILPFYLVTLLVALTTRLKQVSTVGRVFAVFGGIFLVLGGIGSIFTGSRSPVVQFFKGAADLLKDLLQFSPEAVIGVGLFLLFYMQVCALLFYLCCNTISRESDSRELPIKALCYTLVLSWIGFLGGMAYRKGYAADLPGTIAFPVFFMLCAIGLLLFYNRVDVPVIIQRKYEGRRPLSRLIYYVFQPGAAGTMRTMLLMMGTMIGLSILIHLRSLLVPTSTTSDPRKWLESLSIPLQVPFFLVFPLGFVAGLKSMKDNYAAQRTLVAIWWGVAGAVASFFTAWASSRSHIATPMFEFVGLIISPFSSAISWAKAGFVPAPTVRIVLGVIGLFFMKRHLDRRRRERQALLEAPTAAGPTTPTETSSPQVPPADVPPADAPATA